MIFKSVKIVELNKILLEFLEFKKSTSFLNRKNVKIELWQKKKKKIQVVLTSHFLKIQIKVFFIQVGKDGLTLVTQVGMQ